MKKINANKWPILFILLVSVVGYVINHNTPDPVYFWTATVMVIIAAGMTISALLGKSDT